MEHGPSLRAKLKEEKLAIWAHTFFTDAKVQSLLLLVLIDFVLGVMAALKAKTFQFDYVATFAKDDLLGKVVPYFTIYVGALVAGKTNMVIPDLNFGVVAMAVYVAVVAAMAGSIKGSLQNLGFSIPSITLAKTAPAAPEPPAPAPPASTP